MSNLIPENPKHIHLTAVCGTAMGALACMLKETGYKITGSDANVYPPMSTFLEEKGVELMEGFKSQNLSPQPDLVVIGNAVSANNPEVEAILGKNIPYCSMPQAVNNFLGKGKKSLVVAGTHGKTTTSSMLAWVLESAGLDPSFIIGGIHNNFSSNYKKGDGEYIVIEGDEYDTAFFDKGAKFFHYKSFYSIITSIEFDHADIFKDFSHVKNTFKKFIDQHDTESTIAVYSGDINIDELTEDADCSIYKYGFNDLSEWRADNIIVRPPWNIFDVYKKDKFLKQFKMKSPGKHNVSNALAVISEAFSLGVDIDSIAKGLETFQGVRRRQEIRGVQKGVTIVDDFAHHPTAVFETTNSFKPLCPKGRLIAVFEPRTNSSMRNVFQETYVKSFEAADIVCIREIPLPEKIPEAERFSSRKLVEDLKVNGKEAYYFNNAEDIISYVTQNARSGDFVLIMSNGGFENIHERLLESLKNS